MLKNKTCVNVAYFQETDRNSLYKCRFRHFTLHTTFMGHIMGVTSCPCTKKSVSLFVFAYNCLVSVILSRFPEYLSASLFVR